MTAIDHKYAALGAPAGFHRHVTAFAVNIAWRGLLASLASVVLGIVPAGLAWAQDGDGRTCPPGTHCRHPPPVGKPCIGFCDPDAPPLRIIFVDLQNSGFQDGTAVYPFRTLPQALAAAAPGYTIAIRTGFYSFQEGRLVFDKAATIRADNGLVTIAASSMWVDAQTGQPSPHPAPYDLVTRGFDDNGIPLNPMRGSQTWSPPQLPDPSLCGGNDRWKPPCTNQIIGIDNNTVKCRASGPLDGHANWMPVTSEGSVRWFAHSYYLQDDDYSLTFCSNELFCRDELHALNLHSEFNSDQTINHFHTWFWDQLHQAVDDDSPYHGECNGCPGRPYPRTHALVDGKEVIIMGLYGLDCGHDNCDAELHPVYALAIHVKEDLSDDTWAIFVRNWGDEGYCSSGQEEIAPQPFTFSFRFKKAGATQVDSVPAAANDPAGEHGTVFFGHSDNGLGLAVSKPALVPNEGAVVTFNLPPSSLRPFINGMLHLKWSVAASSFSPVPFRGQPVTSLSAIDTEGEGADTDIARAIAKMTPTQRNAVEKALPIPSPAPSGSKLELRPAELRAPVRRGPPAVKHVPDVARDQKEQQINETVRRILLPRE